MARPSPHDRALFEDLFAELRLGEPGLRAGAMFGCPAAFLGRRLAFCVYGSQVAAKLLADDADGLIEANEANEATTFRPFNRPAMSGWVALQPPPANAVALAPILRRAIEHARDRL